MGSKKTHTFSPDFQGLMERLGVYLDAETLRLALTHRSYAFEHNIANNERLEFLGDSVLGLAVTEYLYRTYPQLSEGQLAKLRSAVVSTQALAVLARSVNLGACVYLGLGEVGSGGRDKSSILADTMEAVFGAVFLEHGMEVARSLVLRLLIPYIEDAVRTGTGTDWKTHIQESSARLGLGEIHYEITGSGPDHGRSFEAVLSLGGQEYGRGRGSSKKVAQQEAAHASYQKILEREQAKGTSHARAPRS